MCTLSVITREDGYLLGMNRDERIERGAAEPPKERLAGDTRAIYPRDVEGGTWIGVNEYRIAFALLNWHDDAIPGRPWAKTRSRGIVIPELLRYSSLQAAQAALHGFDLTGILPFRLIGVAPAEQRMSEWTWDLGQVRSVDHAWRNRHWFSSGRSQRDADQLRGGVCAGSWEQAEAGSAAWMRSLHSSHVNGPGPFSICVHAEGVRTVSYTEIESAATAVRLSYFPGNPCSGMSEPVDVELALVAG